MFKMSCYFWVPYGYYLKTINALENPTFNLTCRLQNGPKSRYL